MHFIIDAILIAVFVLTVIHYFRIGFIKALFSVCKFFVSIIIALALASQVGATISEKAVYTPIYNAVNKEVEGIAEGLGQNADISELVSKLPGSVTNLIISSEGIDQSLLNSTISEETIKGISANIAGKISSVISNIIAFLILFIVSLLVLTIIAFILDKICKLPILKQTNKILGLCFGLIGGVFNVLFACTIITLVLHMIGVNSPELSAEAMKEKTVIYSIVENIDISYSLLSFFSKK